MSLPVLFYVRGTTHRGEHNGTKNEVHVVRNLDDIDEPCITIPGNKAAGQGFKGDVVQTSDYSIEELKESLQRRYFRLEITGDNAWQPENLVVWAASADANGRTKILPLVCEVSGIPIAPLATMSSDVAEGVVSIPLKKAQNGTDDDFIVKVIYIVETGDAENDGTENDVTFTIFDSDPSMMVSFNNLRVNRAMTSSYGKLSRGSIRVYQSTSVAGFLRGHIKSPGCLIEIFGDDAWKLESLSAFGVAESGAIVPLVSAEDVRIVLSSDPHEGVKTTVIPGAELA